MSHRVFLPRTFLFLSAALGGLLCPVHAASVPPPAPPSTVSGSGLHHFHHYGHYRHYGHYNHSQHSNADISGGATGTEESFVRDGRRYYWHYRNGHRFYSSHPGVGDTVGPDLGVGSDLDAPLSRQERAQRAARIQQAQARLAAVEKRVARQRHLLRLRELAAKPKLRRNEQRNSH